MKKFTKLFSIVALCLFGVLGTQAKVEQVHATFENPSNTNTTWNAETKTFTWSTTYYNQLRNIGLPSGDITKYKKLVVDTDIKSGEQFRILIYKGGSNLTLYASNGVNEFILADTLKALYPDTYNEFLLACDEICLSGNNNAAPGEAVINDVYLETYNDEGEKVYATFENPSNTNTTWNAETKTFTWSTTYYNQLRNIGLPSGDITKYKKLVVDTEIKSGEQFRILFYKGGSNKTLYASNGVNEFILADTLKALYPDDYNEFLLACDEICLSGNNNAAPGEAIINSVYLETYPENEVVDIPDIVYEEDPGKPEGDYVDFTEVFTTLQPRIGLGEDGHPIVLGNGDVVVGQRSKDVIADLSEYSKLTFVTSPNLKLVLYMNHEVDAQQNAGDYAEADAGKYVFMDVQADENGLIEVDLTQFTKQNLNCIALPWDNTNKGTVWYILLTKGGEVDPLAGIKKELTEAIDLAKMISDFAYTDESFGALTQAIADADAALVVEDATEESLTAALEAVNAAKEALEYKEGYTALTADMFKKYASVTEPGEGETAYPAYELFTASGLPYGDGNVGELNWADLTDYDQLIVITQGDVKPRFCLNRLEAGGQQAATQEDSKMLDINPNNDYTWSTERYQTIEGNVYTIDLTKIVADYEFARLHCIKKQGWGDGVFVTDMLLYKKAEPVVATHTWDFTQWSEETVANLKADAAASKTAGWSDVEKKADAEADGEPTALSKDNCFWYVGGEEMPTANEQVIEELKGLSFNTSYGAARSLAIAVNYQDVQTYDEEGNVTANAGFGPYNGPAYLWLGGKGKEVFTIKNVKAGTTITMGVESHKITDARGVTLSVNGEELKDAEGQAVAAPKTYTEQTWKVIADGKSVYDVVVKNTNGCHLYFIDAEIDQTATSIETVKQNEVANGVVYNLAGQRVAQPTKGLFIVNGKKVVVK